MNILVLNGSPKGQQSNTFKLTGAFLEGITQTAEASVDIVDVNKLNLRECRGCFACWNKTPGSCVIGDDMSTVIQKLLHADIVMWSFPLYYFSLPSRLKMLIDRMLPMSLPFMESSADAGGHRSRYNMDAQRHVLVSTCGFYTAEGNYTAVNEQFDKMLGKGNYAALYCGQGELFRVPELSKRTDEYLAAVKTAGAEFAGGAITKETAEKLAQLLYPREVFEQMADASWGVETRDSETVAVDGALTFTKQMAALYNKAAWPGHDLVIEFQYTDVQKSYQILLAKDGHTVLEKDFLPYTTKITTPLAVWQKIGSGELSGEQALAEHLYQVTGAFDVMLKWDHYFGWADEQEKVPKKNIAAKKTNMTVMLLPWMAIWVLLSINSYWGGIAGVVICAALPFAFLKYRPTVFEYITILAVSSISLLSVLGYSVVLLIPASYLLFGVMWSVTAFLKIPLTAYYSMNDYGEEKAFGNPLFIKTNRILTACWGVLYLITPIWTYALLQTDLSGLTGLFNSVLPIIMGIFTMWFQKWYPKYYAAKGA